MRMEDYFDMLRKAAARNAAREKGEATNGHDNTSNHDPRKGEELDNPED